MWDEWYNSGVSLVLGIVLLILGGLPLFNTLGILPFGLPEFMTTVMAKIVLYLCALGGLWLLWDAWFEDVSDFMRWSSVVVGVAVLVVSIPPLLAQWGVIASSFIPEFALTFYNVVFLVEGILLVVGAFSL